MEQERANPCQVGSEVEAGACRTRANAAITPISAVKMKSFRIIAREPCADGACVDNSN